MSVNKRQLNFLSQDLQIKTWDDLKPYADNLQDREISNVKEYGQWLNDWFEMQLALAEEYHWRYIRQTQNTADEEAVKNYKNYFGDIESNLTVLNNKLEQKALSSEYLDQYQEKGFDIIRKSWKSSNALYVESNVSLQADTEVKAAEYNAVRGPMTVTLDGEELTLQQAGTRLEWSDREKRQEAWLAMRSRMQEGKEAFDGIMASLVEMRHQIALNAGYDNFRDYMFEKLQRFDYGTKEAFVFHEAVEKKIVPVLRNVYRKQAEALGLEKLRPWDVDCDPYGRPELKAFKNSEELKEKLQYSADQIDPDFSNTISGMMKSNMFDLDSRPNKASGAYNASMPVSKTSFMFGNVTGSTHDLVTSFHEGGHALHAHLMMDLPLLKNEDVPMEMAELASMAMELISHDQWEIFFQDDEQCSRAKLKHYQDILYVMTLVAEMDSFQHTLYENPLMTPQQRHETYKGVKDRYDTGMIDWSGLEEYQSTYWHNQRHLFGTPFYMLEYGFAQTGALGIDKNYQENPELTLNQYKKALSLGCQVTLPELYKTAGVEFDFGVNKLDELMKYLEPKIERLSIQSQPKLK
jgi:oligoendopeptidase F